VVDHKGKSSAKLSSQSPCPSPSSSTGGMNSAAIANSEELSQNLPEEFDEDANEHRLLTARRNFDKVCFGQWQMKTWYFSPYPVSESDDPLHTSSSATPTPSSSQSFPNATSRTKIQGLARTTLRSHGRTADLVAGGLGRENVVSATGQRDAILWVCDRCFKYMREGSVWELHMKSCDMKHPPGRKVYQRGAHIIWEVDGSKQKLYCQNLSLFGKLFIDVKTLFFDCDNFMFYILTDADSQRDHVLGFFSKEKISYDDFNLACIVILPPYQKKGYGMLLIEFSYELSRRAHKLGTPERPLSDLGLRGYLAYWTAVLVRFFRHLLGTEEQDPSDGSPSNGDVKTPRSAKKKRVKGFEGEVAAAEADRVDVSAAAVSLIEGDSFGSLRTTHTMKDPSSGKSTIHVSIKCTLLDIAHATYLRPDDVAFTLAECGLLARRKDVEKEEGTIEEEIVISREMVEAVANERGVKRMCMDRAHVLL